jgi:hypothetical protein
MWFSLSETLRREDAIVKQRVGTRNRKQMGDRKILSIDRERTTHRPMIDDDLNRARNKSLPSRDQVFRGADFVDPYFDLAVSIGGSSDLNCS